MIDPTARVDASAVIERARDQVGGGTTIGEAARCATARASVETGWSGPTSSSMTGVDPRRSRPGPPRGDLYVGVSADDAVFIGPGAILTNYRRPRALEPRGEPLGREDWEISPIHLSSGRPSAPPRCRRPVRARARAMIGAGAVVTHDVPATRSSRAIPPRASDGHASAAADSIDSTGHNAPAERERYALDQALACPVCERRYAYVRDEGTLREEKPSSAVGPASA